MSIFDIGLGLGCFFARYRYLKSQKIFHVEKKRRDPSPLHNGFLMKS